MTAVKHHKTTGEYVKWNEAFILRAYKLARSGMSVDEIARVLGVGESTTIDKWIKKYPLFKNAIKEGTADCPHKRKGATVARAFQNYLFDRLPKNLQRLWREIEECDMDGDEINGTVRLDALMRKMGERARQQLFIHSFTTSSFRFLPACKKVGISPQMVQSWIEEDPEFCELYQQIIDLKKDFFEDALLELVNLGNPAAIIYANKTQNVERGYGEKAQEHHHSGTVNQNVTVVDVAALGLSVEMQKEILTKIREQKQGAIPAPAPDRILNAEFKEAEEVAMLTKDIPEYFPPVEDMNHGR